ncbi:MAG: 16S rRNA (cytosine(1402)-N(4))-methyltransferase RsmH [Paludibacteraceae bacterium]|nr:16S rRNA (cytosine(1402)-N(4))-methyltransferase RsmH [Paludibacteraceae bacterium]
MNEVYHIPAMLEQTVDGLNIRPDGTYVDVTFGGGGHSRAILERLGQNGRLFSMDQDIDAYHNECAQENRQLADDNRWQFVHSNFRYLGNFMDYYGVQQIDGLLADLGVSFHHFDSPERGFSFRFSAPLDMRMNQNGGRTAADILNTYDEENLARVLYIYGELKQSRMLARKIVTARQKAPILRTEELVAILGDEKKTLTLAFQALRIEVNDELGALREMLLTAKALLRKGGHISVLTYHSLEDRIVKNFLRSGNIEGTIEKDFYGNILTPFRVIEKGINASEEEINRNPRARSAKLRIAEKL